MRTVTVGLSSLGLFSWRLNYDKRVLVHNSGIDNRVVLHYQAVSSLKVLIRKIMLVQLGGTLAR